MCRRKSNRAIGAVLIFGLGALFAGGCAGFRGPPDSPAEVEGVALAELQRLTELGERIVSVGPAGIRIHAVGACIPTPKPNRPHIELKAAQRGFDAAQYIHKSREQGMAPTITILTKCETMPPD